MIRLGATGTILGAELRALRNRLVRRGRVRLVLLAVFLLGAAVFIGGSAFVAGATVGHFLPLALDSFLAGGFTALSVLMLVLGFPTVIATFFVGRDLLQLVIAPVRTVEIFAARLLLAMSANFLISAILLMGVLGLGFGVGAPALYYPVAAVLIFGQVLIVTSLQAILMTMILRWVPARLARDVAAGVAGVTGAGFYLAWNLSLRRSFAGGATRPDVSNLTGFVRRIDWLPTSWPGHALGAIVAGDAVTSLLWALGAVALAVALLTAAEVLYGRTLLAGLGVFGMTPVTWRRRVGRSAPSQAGRGVGSPLLAIARKDWLAFRRDIRRLGRLLPAMLFPLGYAVVLSQPSRSLGGFWANVALVVFMSMFMSTMLASPSIPSERRGFQLLRMAPLTMWQVLRAKVLLTLPPVLTLTLVFGVVVARVSGSGAGQIIELCLLVIWSGVGFVSIGVSSGGIDPRFDATDDRRSVGIVGTLAGIGGSLGFGLLSVGAFALFLFGADAAAGTAQLGVIPSTPLTGGLMWLLGVTLGAGAVGLVGFLLWTANRRLNAFEGVIADT